MSNLVMIQSEKDFILNTDDIHFACVSEGELKVWTIRDGDAPSCRIRCNQSIDYILEQINNGDKTIRVLV